MNLNGLLNQAEGNARERDRDKEKEQNKIDRNGVSDEEFQNALELLNKATGKEYGIYEKKSKQSKFKFAQVLQLNWDYLREQKYLTSEERLFLADLQAKISISSNALVKDIKKKPPEALNIQGIANVLDTSRTKISRVVNNLIEKGILAKAVSGYYKDIKQAKDYVLFVNPNVYYSGDKDKVSEHLILLFQNQMKKNNVLKKIPQKLF